MVNRRPHTPSNFAILMKFSAVNSTGRRNFRFWRGCAIFTLKFQRGVPGE
ncbi:hypothetical protein SAMN05216367_5251 [Tardiphaga sp. OK245]|nr:hypothetical protein SAMN05216367_5251 [Tardiphaga sp. OK245]